MPVDADMSDASLLLRPDEVARALSVSRSAAYRLISEGQLPSVRLGKSVRVPRLALERWIEERTAAARAAAAPASEEALAR